MPIFSYIAYPVNGAQAKLLKDLKAMDYCEVEPADNKDILILITDTPDENQEKILQQKLKNLKSLQSLGMTFGHTDQ
jgi:nitrate reductase NapAB chaperone NapD